MSLPYSVIIPSRNAVNLRACVAAIKSERAASIIVVDDGLPLGAQHYAAPARIVKGAEPFVFARNINIGIREAGENDVILINDDAILETTGGFDKLSDTSAENPEYGVIASSCNNVGNPNQHRALYMQPTEWYMKLRDEPRMVCFVCVYIPRKTINTVGLLDERYVDYGMDDDDYCLTVRNAGLKIGIYDGCYVNHNHLESSYRGRGGGDFRSNLRRFIAKWGFDNWGNTRDNSPFQECFPVCG